MADQDGDDWEKGARVQAFDGDEWCTATITGLPKDDEQFRYAVQYDELPGVLAYAKNVRVPRKKSGRGSFIGQRPVNSGSPTSAGGSPTSAATRSPKVNSPTASGYSSFGQGPPSPSSMGFMGLCHEPVRRESGASVTSQPENNATSTGFQAPSAWVQEEPSALESPPFKLGGVEYAADRFGAFIDKSIPTGVPPSASVRKDSDGKWSVDTSYIQNRTSTAENLVRKNSDDFVNGGDQFWDPASVKCTYDQLQRKMPNVDPKKKEQYLSDKEFHSVFEMSAADFAKLAKWKQASLKKDKQLF